MNSFVYLQFCLIECLFGCSFLRHGHKCSVHAHSHSSVIYKYVAHVQMLEEKNEYTLTH